MKLSARFEIRINGRRNRARFTRSAANRIAIAKQAFGDKVAIVEHR